MSEPAREPVKTEYGLVQGVPSEFVSPNITVYRGIPYAASTAGENRWREPQDPPSWEGVRVMDKFGPICPQARTEEPTSEDCLSLNIWVPPNPTGEKLPVYVWIYGGRFIFGAGKEPIYDGAGLARKGVIVVNFNYRLGALGFLAHPDLTAESPHHSSGNYGLLDMIKALQWVQSNIAHFGGDPSRVTIGGQSAGAASVMDLVDSPLATNLFRAAIAESGARYPHDPLISSLAPSYRRTLAEAEAAGESYLRTHHVSSIAALRALPASSILEGATANDPAPAYAPKTSGMPPPLFRPVLDNHVFTRPYAAALASTLHNDIPILTGHNADEGGASPSTSTTLSAFHAALSATYGPLAPEYSALYPAATDAQASAQTNALARDNTRISTYLWAEARARASPQKSFIYFWTHGVPGRRERGAYHGAEMHYVFGTLYAGEGMEWTEEDRRVAEVAAEYWANFIKGGDPNGAGLERWEAVRTGETRVMELGNVVGSVPVADAERKIELARRWFDGQPAW